MEKIKDNDYNLSVNRYIETQEQKEETDIQALNQEIREIVKREQEVRERLDSIITELEA
ncbi:type I restriction-modification system M protein [Helicobacter mustelae]|nr:type I restriction-modification system M protein [Helicobacter mustelae]